MGTAMNRAGSRTVYVVAELHREVSDPRPHLSRIDTHTASIVITDMVASTDSLVRRPRYRDIGAVDPISLYLPDRRTH